MNLEHCHRAACVQIIEALKQQVETWSLRAEAHKQACVSSEAALANMTAERDHYKEMDALHIQSLGLKSEKLAAMTKDRKFLIDNATRSVSWIDGVIEILELYRPETPSQRDWQKQMVDEGYAIIQDHVEVRILEDE